MKIRQLGSTIGVQDARQYLTSYLVDDCVAIDAGSLGFLSPLSLQQSIQHLFLSHSHLDHVASLPTFLDNVHQGGSDCPTVYGSRDVLDCLSRDLFNERLWPDLDRLAEEGICFYKPAEIQSEVPVIIGSLTITPVNVDHVVPTMGFLIQDAQSAVVITSDSGPTDRIWELANEPAFRQKLKVAFLECSFPNDMDQLAQKSKHLCTQQFALEIAKVSAGPPFQTVAVHLKPSFEAQIYRELMALNLPNLQIGGQDATWEL